MPTTRTMATRWCRSFLASSRPCGTPAIPLSRPATSKMNCRGAAACNVSLKPTENTHITIVRRVSPVELLTCDAHTTHPADLQRCVSPCRSDAVPVAQPAFRQPWSLRDRLDERTSADLIAAYVAGTTAA